MTPDRTTIELPRPEEFETMSASAVRETFLLPDLFETGKLKLVFTSLDRLTAGGAIPETELALPPCPEFGTKFFNERRETGVLNIGSPGAVRVGDETFELGHLDCLYVGAGEREVVFSCTGADAPVFFLLSCPAHSTYSTRKATRDQAQVSSVGDETHASRRCIHKYIHPSGIASSQLVMGFTELAPGSVWNTMPSHTHSRRSEIYLYFDLGENVVVRDRQAVLSPPWSIHTGAGSSSYRFIWGMAGENQDFGDMDGVALNTLA